MIKNMKTKTLLINLPCYLSMKDFVENDYGYNPSLGLLAIAEYLGLFEFETKVIDYNYTNIDYESLERIILDENYSVVGITAYTENLNLVLKFDRNNKENKQTHNRGCWWSACNVKARRYSKE